MNKLFLLIIFFLLAIPKGFNCHAFDPSDFSECSGDRIADIDFGVRNVTWIDEWCSIVDNNPCFGPGDFFCREQPADPYFELWGVRDLELLVKGNYVTGQDYKYWIQFGGDGQQYCVDDEVQDNLDGNCLVMPINYNCPQTIWVQIMTECDRCVRLDNGFPAGGTWWKATRMFGADELTINNPGACNSSFFNNVFLELQDLRTECGDVTTRWGCGPEETQG